MNVINIHEPSSLSELSAFYIIIICWICIIIIILGLLLVFLQKQFPKFCLI